MTKRIYNIGVEATMDVIGGKWKPIILCNLRHGQQRPSELRRNIQKMLTQQLRELEQDNIVVRKSYNTVPPKVEYYLSDYGRSLEKLLDTLCSWGEMHVSTLQAKGEDVALVKVD